MTLFHFYSLQSGADSVMLSLSPAGNSNESVTMGGGEAGGECRSFGLRHNRTDPKRLVVTHIWHRCVTRLPVNKKPLFIVDAL